MHIASAEMKDGILFIKAIEESRGWRRKNYHW